MPAKLIFTQDQIDYYVSLFHGDLSVKDTAKSVGRDPRIIRTMWRAYFNMEEHSERCSRLNRLHKVGSLNPMWGKTGILHHNFVEDKYDSSGYRLITCPNWYLGKAHANNLLEHIVVYCEHNHLAELPYGMVIHHIDFNKINNHIDNLVMMTISDHMKLHNNFRKRATTIPKGSTPQASAEAQSN